MATAWRVLASLALAAGNVASAAQPLLFVSNRDGSAQIYRMNADGSGERALTRGPAENTEPAWSPDGSAIAFTSYRDGNAEVYVMRADGSAQVRLTRDAAADNAPAWLPDGRIVFRSLRGRWSNLYAMKSDGSALVPLTADEVDKGPPLPSPDGRWIAYVSHAERGGSDIQLVPTTGGAPRNLTAAGSSNPKMHPTWSPDGSRIAYTEAKGVTLNVRVIACDGGTPVAITENVYTNAAPVWSPDGRRLAFVSSREGATRSERARGDIWLMDADGGNAVNLTRHPDEDNYPAWAPDGRTVLFVSLRDGPAQIYSIAASGGEARRLTRDAGHNLMIRPLTLRESAVASSGASPTANLTESR